MQNNNNDVFQGTLTDELLKRDRIFITEPINRNTILNLETISNNYNTIKTIVIVLKEQNHNDIKNMVLYSVTRELNLKFLIIIDEGEVMDFSWLNNIYYNKVEILKSSERMSLSHYTKMENKINHLLGEISLSKLSLFEKYIYVYNLVKNYKPYKDCEYNNTESRFLSKVLFNEYIVCFGYSKLLVELLLRLGIKAIMIDNDFSIIGYDNNVRYEHSRVLVKLKDEKYNISGVYLCDPTWDNHKGMDLYIHLAITPQEMSYRNVMSYLGEIPDFLDVYSIEEFFDKFQRFPDVYFDTLWCLEKLDYDGYLNILSKYGYEKTNTIYSYKFLDEGFKKKCIDKRVLKDLGNHFINKPVKTIPYINIIKGLSEVMLFENPLLEENDMFRKLKTITIDNSEKFDTSFPSFKKIKDNKVEVIANSKNRFSISEEELLLVKKR